MDSVVVEDAPKFCSASEETASSPSSSPLARDNVGMYFNFGVISAIISLFILPEIFGTIGVILGAYTWRKEQGNRGGYLVVAGVICMLVGLYLTAYFILGDLLPS
jgi:hypothetical protein